MNRTKIEIQKYELNALATLNDHQVEYLLIGGFALRHWGHRRSTEDVDLLANNSPENARRLYDAIRAIPDFVPRFTFEAKNVSTRSRRITNNIGFLRSR